MNQTKDTGQKSYPLLPLRNVLVFPGTTISLEVGRPKSVKAVEIAQSSGMSLVMCSQKATDIAEPLPEHIYSAGTLGIIKEAAKTASGNLRIVVEGLKRIRISSYITNNPAYVVTVEELKDGRTGSEENELLVKNLMEQYEEYVRVTRNVPAETLISIASVTDAGLLCDTVAGHIPVSVDEKQKVLETIPVRERTEKLLDILNKEIELASLEKRINMRVRKQIERSQKEYWLRAVSYTHLFSFVWFSRRITILKEPNAGLYISTKSTKLPVSQKTHLLPGMFPEKGFSRHF